MPDAVPSYDLAAPIHFALEQAGLLDAELEPVVIEQRKELLELIEVRLDVAGVEEKIVDPDEQVLA